jgi:two-component sensor histidine kinase
MELFNDINNSMGSNFHKLTIEGDDGFIQLHNAVAAGLLFNELFTNSIKHSFKNKAEGEIFIEIKNRANETTFKITESEGAFPEELDFENSNSTGLTLIKTFTEQLNGEISLEKKPKTRFSLSLDLS